MTFLSTRKARLRPIALCVQLVVAIVLVLATTQCEASGKKTGGGTTACSKPCSPWQGQIVGSDYGHGDTVAVACNSDYKNAGDERLICNNGAWEGESGKVPKCVVVYDDEVDGKWDFSTKTHPSSELADDSWWLMTDEKGAEQKEEAECILWD